MTTQYDFGGVLGRPLDTFFWVLTNMTTFLVTALGSCVKWPSFGDFWPLRLRHHRSNKISLHLFRRSNNAKIIFLAKRNKF